jgi:hypothetical protein
LVHVTDHLSRSTLKEVIMSKNLQTTSTAAPTLPQGILDAIARIDAAAAAGPTLLSVISENNAAIQQATAARDAAADAAARATADVALREAGSAVSHALRDRSFDAAGLKVAREDAQTLESAASSARAELDRLDRLDRALRQRQQDTQHDLREARADLERLANEYGALQATLLLPALETAVEGVVTALHLYLGLMSAIPNRAAAFAVAETRIASPCDFGGRSHLLDGDTVAVRGALSSVARTWRDSPDAVALANALQPIADALRRAAPPPEEPRHQDPKFSGWSYSVRQGPADADDDAEGAESAPRGFKPGPPTVSAVPTSHRAAPQPQELNMGPALVDGPTHDPIQR